MIDLIDWVFEVEFTRPDDEKDACAGGQFVKCGHKGVAIHEVDFAVIGADIPSAECNKIAVFIKPFLWVIVQRHQRNDVRHVHVGSGAEDCVVLVEARTKPVTGLDEVDEESLINAGSAIIFAVEVVKEACVQGGCCNEKDGGNSQG